MFNFFITSQLSGAVKELAWLFNLGTTDHLAAIDFSELWKKEKEKIEDINAIRQELAGNRRKVVGYPEAMEEYQAEIERDLVTHCRQLQSMIDNYLQHEDRRWFYQPVLPELRTGEQHDPGHIMLLFARHASELGDALQRLCAVIQQTLAYPKLTSIERFPVTDKQPAPKDESLTLSGRFEYTSRYKKVMQLLVDNGMCQAGTYVWIDYGPGSKGLVAGLIKHLHAQGFYIDDRLPSNKELLRIVKNTFGIEISIDTAKKAKTGENHNFSFIGPASTLD